MSKTQKGLIGVVVLVLIVLAFVFLSAMHSAFAHGCVSQTARCFERASRLSLGRMLWEMLMCVFNSLWCVVQSIWDMCVTWFNRF